MCRKIKLIAVIRVIFTIGINVTKTHNFVQGKLHLKYSMKYADSMRGAY